MPDSKKSTPPLAFTRKSSRSSTTPSTKSVTACPWAMTSFRPASAARVTWRAKCSESRQGAGDLEPMAKSTSTCYILTCASGWYTSDPKPNRERG